MTGLTHITGQVSYLSNNLPIHMNLLRLSPPESVHLYDFIISGESGYLLLDESLVNPHPKQS